MLYGILKLRSDVFVVEQECVYPDIDDRDREPDALHLWVGGATSRSRTSACSTARPPGRAASVASSPRRAREARASPPALMHKALAATMGPVVLDAQSYLVDWYQGLGFQVDGDEYLDDGIPHTPMKLER